MTMDEAFAKWAKNHELYDLPWQIDQKVLRGAFEAGWMAHAEAGKQTLMLHVDDERTAVGLPTVGAVVDRIAERSMAEMIYKAYPRKVGKGAAMKAIQKAIAWCQKRDAVETDLGGGARGGADWLLSQVQAYTKAVSRWPTEERKFVPHPATWFNQERYLDDPKEWQRGAAAVPSQFTKTYQ